MRRRLSRRLRLLAAGLIVAPAIAGCDGIVHGTTRPAAAVRTLRYADPQGWSLRYARSLTLEHSTSGPGMATFTEVTVANFAQQTAVVTGRTRDGGFIRVRPPLDHVGRFPADGVAFRMLLVDGPPMIGTWPDSRFPVTLSTFAPSHPRAFSARARAAIRAVIASLTFPRLRTGQRAGEESVLGPASSYPVGSFTLVHAPGQVCNGIESSCFAADQPFYLVHAPGRLHQPDLIGPCQPTPACTPPGAFYALGWTNEDVRGGYRSACHLRLDRRDKQFFCTNSPARWDRAGRVIRMPPGAPFPDGLQFAFAKIAWDGHVVFLPGLGGNPPRAAAYAQLWPAHRRG